MEVRLRLALKCDALEVEAFTLRAYWRLHAAGAPGAPHSESDPDFVAGEGGGDSDSEWNAAESDDDDNHAGRHPRYSIPMGAPMRAQYSSMRPACRAKRGAVQHACVKFGVDC